MQINFNEPLIMGEEINYIEEAIKNNKICGDGEFTQKCNKWFETKFYIHKVLMTTSCTHALEMAALLLEIKPGDEIIMPSFTFVSTANAFVLRGARIKFIDIRPDTMNMDEEKIEEAITNKTKAIVPVHYAGVACEMKRISEIARQYQLYIVEDAAQAMMSTYEGRALGTIGDFGCYSFHETKNYTMGEGGALLINLTDYDEKAEIIREKGTNRNQFLRGDVDKYSWVDKGSSYLPSELNTACLYAQLKYADEVNNNRLCKWRLYYKELLPLQSHEIIDLPYIPSQCKHNAHMFYIKVKSVEVRTKLINFLKNNGIQSAFHYVPLHISNFGKQCGEFVGSDIYTTKESERLLRLPMHYNLTKDDINYITTKIKEFFSCKK